MSIKPGLTDSLTDGDDLPEDCEATGSGILRCLEMLADEAMALRMQRTLDALLEAVNACSAEMTDEPECLAPDRSRVSRLH